MSSDVVQDVPITAKRLAAVLHDPQYVLFSRVLKVLGEDRSIVLLVEALTIEAAGGLHIRAGERKHTLGGLFIRLVKERSTPVERRRIFQ